MPDAHENFAYSTVITAPSPAVSGTSLQVTLGEGSLFPAVPFNATVWPANTVPRGGNAEIIRVTARVANTFTIIRAQEDTTARTIGVGDQISAAITKKAFTDIEDAYDAIPQLSHEDGLTETIVGDTLVISNDHRLVWARRTTNGTSITSSITQTADNVIVLPVEANTTYELGGMVLYNSPTGADIRLGWTVPTSATMAWMAMGAGTDLATPATALTMNAGFYTQAQYAVLGGAGALQGALLGGWLTTLGTAGNLVLTFAQNVSTASATGLLAGTYGRLTRIA